MVSLPIIVHIGAGLTITVSLQTLEQPSMYVTVTEYRPGRLTVMQLVVAPVLHK
jgi:hypothetical protein